MKISETEIQVRYAETDQMGVVYHANYLVWFEIGRTQLVKDLGLDYLDMEKAGYLAPVGEVHITYKKPVRYGESAKIRTWIETYTGVKTIYGYEIVDENGEVCVTGTSSHIVVKKENFRPVSLKKSFPNWHEIYEEQKKPHE